LRLDGGLVEKVAVSHPEWQIVLIGEADHSFPKERLETLPNVTFLGSKTPQQIPAYLEAMDVLINPQLLNEVTIGNYPRKIDEYLAMGKPVVAVKTETMKLFEKHVNLADNADEFTQCIADVLAGKELSSATERIAFALEHTWENSMASLIEAIHRLTKTHQKTM
jgi:teichuronic acid biosynthesis glycosyltransferase TuaH